MNKNEIEAILADIKYENWEFYVGWDPNLYLQVQVQGVCNVTGKPLNWNGRKWKLSPHMCKNELVLTAFKAVLTALEHEAREKFLYRGRSILDPHYDVDKLWELRGQDEALDERTPPADMLDAEHSHVSFHGWVREGDEPMGREVAVRVYPGSWAG